MCFVCGMDNPIGLHAQFYNMEDGSVITPIRFTDLNQSFPGRVHGGLLATLMDELGLRALWAGGDESVFGVTMTLNAKYRKPVPYNTDLIGRGEIVKSTSMFVNTKAGIYDMQGNLLAEADIKYVKLDMDKIAQDADAHEEMAYYIEDDVKEIDFCAG